MADTPLSKAAVDRAGKRLRDEVVPRPEDVAVYEEYRASLAPALDETATAVREIGRDTGVAIRFKRIESTIAKLRRGTFNLSQIQDIAGCRLIVQGLGEQDLALAALVRRLDCRRVTDYREVKHAAGYVAVHLLVRAGDDMPVEVQIRTRVQHLWAAVSEQLASRPIVGVEIKYGGGPPDVRAKLNRLATECRMYDECRARARAAVESIRFVRSRRTSERLARRASGFFDELDSLWETIDQQVAELVGAADNEAGG